MLSVTKNVEKANVTKNGKNDQIYDMKLNERVKNLFIKISYATVLKT